MCIIFCLVEISAQILVFMSKIGLFTKLETFFSISFVDRLIKTDQCFSSGKTVVYGWDSYLWLCGYLVTGLRKRRSFSSCCQRVGRLCTPCEGW